MSAYPQLIFVNGNIGSGKETVLRFIHKTLTNRGFKVKLILEPVDEYIETGVLQKLYEGKHFDFQKYAITARVKALLREYDLSYDFIFMETNFIVDLEVYSKAVLKGDEFKEYCVYYQNEVSKVKHLRFRGKMSDLFLDVKPEVSFERIKMRSRDEEMTISQEYLQKLWENHLQLNAKIQPHVIRNDCELCDNEDIRKYLDQLISFM